MSKNDLSLLGPTSSSVDLAGTTNTGGAVPAALRKTHGDAAKMAYLKTLSLVACLNLNAMIKAENTAKITTACMAGNILSPNTSFVLIATEELYPLTEDPEVCASFGKLPAYISFKLQSMGAVLADLLKQKALTVSVSSQGNLFC